MTAAWPRQSLEFAVSGLDLSHPVSCHHPEQPTQISPPITNHSFWYLITPYLRLLPKHIVLFSKITDLVFGIPLRPSRAKHVVSSQ